MWEDTAFGNYIAGLADADSSFYLEIHRKKGNKFGWGILPIWTMDKAGEKPLLQSIANFFGVGRIYEYSSSKKENHPRIRFVVDGHSCSRLVDFFDKFPLRGKKHLEFELWKQAVEIYSRRRRHCRASWTKEEMLTCVRLKREMSSMRLKGSPTVDLEKLEKELLSS